MRLIDSDALVDSLGISDRDIYCKYTIEDAPTIEAEPVRHGWWVKEDDRYYHWHCSECGSVWGAACVGMMYCPKCGAKMERDSEDD